MEGLRSWGPILFKFYCHNLALEKHSQTKFHVRSYLNSQDILKEKKGLYERPLKLGPNFLKFLRHDKISEKLTQIELYVRKCISY